MFLAKQSSNCARKALKLRNLMAVKLLWHAISLSIIC